MLRTLLVLLHDFPEFLSDYHLSFCDVIPPSCIQLRNLVLAAFPRSMRLPDPFTPNLKVRCSLGFGFAVSVWWAWSIPVEKEKVTVQPLALRGLSFLRRVKWR